MSKEASGKRSASDRAIDRALIASWLLEGMDYREMETKINEMHLVNGVHEAPYPISYITICKDANRNVKVWQKRAIRDVGKLREIEMAKLRKVEAANWRGWKKSVESPNGPNPTFLRNLASLSEQRCKLLGLNAPEQVEVQANWAGLLKDEHEHTVIDVDASEAPGELEEAAGEADGKPEATADD